MKKAATKRENEKKELADVVEQDRLIEMKGELITTLSNR
jgi:nucleosome binding factor SPN SPT16 subunit